MITKEPWLYDLKLPGGAVIDPENNVQMGIDIYEQPSKYIYDDIIDFDATSMHPSLILSNNMDSTTLIGKIFIKNEEYTDGKEKEKFKDPSAIMQEIIIDGNLIHLANKYLNCPTIEELIKEIDNE